MRVLLLSVACAAVICSTALAQAPKSVPAPPDVVRPPADAMKSASGLAWRVLKPGAGAAHPTPDELVTVHFTAWTTDGKTIETSSGGKAAVFQLEKVVPGLVEGMQMMTIGESRRFWVPQALAYKGQRDRPKGMVVFDVELIGITEYPKPPADLKAPPASATKTSSGLAYLVMKQGSGFLHPRPTSTVTVIYSGWSTDGKMFDSSVTKGEPVTFQLNSVISGWSEGLQLMVEGERTLFWIPEDQAYKGRGPVNGMLVFDVELVKIQ